jgi:ubiquinone/menaquinone biosynthesis C-methylase UbiE
MKLTILALAIASLLSAQVATKANSHYQTEQGRQQVSAGMLSPDRDREQRPRELIASLEIKPGMTVADIGTGPGYMLPYLSSAAGPKGRVIAEDIFPDMLERAKQRIAAERLANVATVLGTATDPKLPAGAVDLAFILEVYHHFDYPDRMLAQIRQALREDGRLAIVDFYRRPGAMPGGNALDHIRADQPEVIKEVESNGFRLLERHDQIPDRQYVLVFRKKQ